MGSSRSMSVIVVLAVLLSPVVACKNADPASQDEGQVKTTLTLLNDSGEASTVFQEGDPIVLELAIRNGTDEDRVYELPDTQRYEFEVHDQALVWRWSDGLFFAQVITRLELPAGGALVFRETWDQSDRDGKPVPAGQYEAEGYVPDRNGRLYADPVAFRIE